MEAGPSTRKRAQDSILALKGNLEGTNDSISNLDGYAFLSLCGAGTQVGGAHHILPVHQGAVRWRRLHIEHIQGCLPNGMHFSITSPKSCFAVWTPHKVFGILYLISQHASIKERSKIRGGSNIVAFDGNISL